MNKNNFYFIKSFSVENDGLYDRKAFYKVNIIFINPL